MKAGLWEKERERERERESVCVLPRPTFGDFSDSPAKISLPRFFTYGR